MTEFVTWRDLEQALGLSHTQHFSEQDAVLGTALAFPISLLFIFLLNSSIFCWYFPPAPWGTPTSSPPIAIQLFWWRSLHRSTCRSFSVAVVVPCSSDCIFTNISHFLWRSLGFLSFSIGEWLSLLSDPWLSLLMFVSYPTNFSSLLLKEYFHFFHLASQIQATSKPKMLEKVKPA